MQESLLDFSIIPRYIPILAEGVMLTIMLTLASVGAGILLGLITALMKMSRIRLLRLIAAAYIEIVRGTPLICQLFLIYFGLPQLLGFNLP
jgi:polar amino acid transport system permease protein